VTIGKRPLFFGIAAVAAAVAVLALTGQAVLKHRRLAVAAQKLADDNDKLREQVTRLRREARALSGDPAALERAAREELGYVRPGEVVFQLDEPRGRP